MRSRRSKREKKVGRVRARFSREDERKSVRNRRRK